MMHFIARLRELSGGKPTGFKFCLGHPWEWFGIVKAMRRPASRPTSSWSTAPRAAPARRRSSSSTTSGAPLQEGLLLVHNTLIGVGLRDRIKHRLRRAR